MWFRSPDSSRSWLLALVAVLDAAALQTALCPTTAPRQARLYLSMGISCLRSFAQALRIPYDPDPLPTNPIRLREEEFLEGVALLAGVGFPMERSSSDAWRHFSGWRVNYEGIVDALTVLVIPPPAPWLLERPDVGSVHFPRILNRTPEDPDAMSRKS
jgi:hypothetical protein